MVFIKKPKIVIKSKKRSVVKPFSFNESVVSSKQKMVLYNPRIKSLLKYVTGIGKKNSSDFVPGAMDVINKHLNSNEKFDLDYTDPKGRFVARSAHNDLRVSSNTDKAYKLDIFFDKKVNSFYIKVAFGNDMSRNATQEMILQKFMEKKGFNILTPKFAFSAVNTELLSRADAESKKGGMHFIVYDYTNLKNVYASFLSKEINSKDYIKISSKVSSILLNFNNQKVRDILSKNIYYEKIKNRFNAYNIYKLYVSDLFVDFINQKKLIEFSKKEGLIK